MYERNKVLHTHNTVLDTVQNKFFLSFKTSQEFKQHAELVYRDWIPNIAARIAKEYPYPDIELIKKRLEYEIGRY